MPRRPRVDAPGMLHHVMSRGLSRRTVFETRRDVRTFLALLASEVRAGRIEVLAFSVLSTHFHLLVRSCTGELSKVMQRVLNVYVRYFNRSRRRDGPLPRGRFVSIPVRSLRYRRVLVRYIDLNAVKARLVSAAALYPYGSASLYAARKLPRWLSTDWVDSLLGDPSPADRPDAYAQLFGGKLSAGDAELIEKRLAHPGDSDDDWDHLLNAAPPRVLAWMTRKARLADGTKPGLPYVPASRVRRVVKKEARRIGPWKCLAGKQRRSDAWPILRVGLLRDLASMTLAEVSRHEGCSPSTVRRREQHHARLLAIDPQYGEVASRLASRCLREP